MSNSPNGSLDTAIKLILKWAAFKKTAQLSHAVSSAYTAALRSLEADLEREHLPELHKRHQQLLALDVANTRIDPDRLPPDDLWRLVLTYLDPGQQQLLQRTYEDFRRSFEAGLIYGDDDADTQQAQLTLNTVAAAENLLAELPHTTFAPPSAPDDHDERRQTLSIEIERRSESEGSPVHVEWLDGYQSRVALMELHYGGAQASWQLEIEDPPPGRGARLELVGGLEGAKLAYQGEHETLDPRTGARLQREGYALILAAAERELENAIAWAQDQITNRFTVMGDAPRAHGSATATQRLRATRRRRPE